MPLANGKRASKGLGAETFQVYLPIIVVDTALKPVAGREFWVEALPQPGFPPFAEKKQKYKTGDDGGFHLYSFVETDGQTNILLSITPLFQYADGDANKAIVWRHPAKLRFGYPSAENLKKDPIVIVLKPGGGIQDKQTFSPPASTLPSPQVEKSKEDEFPWQTVGLVAAGIAVIAIGYFFVFPAIFGKKRD